MTNIQEWQVRKAAAAMHPDVFDENGKPLSHVPSAKSEMLWDAVRRGLESAEPAPHHALRELANLWKRQAETQEANTDLDNTSRMIEQGKLRDAAAALLEGLAPVDQDRLGEAEPLEVIEAATDRLHDLNRDKKVLIERVRKADAEYAPLTGSQGRDQKQRFEEILKLRGQVAGLKTQLDDVRESYRTAYRKGLALTKERDEAVREANELDERNMALAQQLSAAIQQRDVEGKNALHLHEEVGKARTRIAGLEAELEALKAERAADPGATDKAGKDAPDLSSVFEFLGPIAKSALKNFMDDDRR
ncbi:MAG: hypothetical protein WC054_00335 [Candidatus Nanopelagicales bacterium]